MEITIIELITKYGLNTVVIGFLIFVFTGLIKIPIKKLANKMEEGSKLTKYITFLPIIIGFGLTVLYKVILHNLVFDDNFFRLWLTSSSLSLAIYAFAEKFFPSRKKILTEQEIKDNKKLIEKIEEVINSDENKKSNENLEMSKQKIILGGKKNNESTEIKDK